jgi:glycosyltransferase involved in cell wall biosynthesis
VTAEALQQRYPPSGPSVAASSIELRDDQFAEGPRRFRRDAGPIGLVFVGSLEQYYKGPDLLIEAVARSVRRRGVDLTLTMVGDGRRRGDLEALAGRLQCGRRIRFAGQLGAGQVHQELDRADLFVLPSRQEGLPRAMLEAMARGLPCIGSRAGGIPELLTPDATVPVGDVEALTDRICEVVRDPVRMRHMSAANLQRVKAYRSQVLQARRVAFYQRVRAATDAWLRRHGMPAATGSVGGDRTPHDDRLVSIATPHRLA